MGYFFWVVVKHSCPRLCEWLSGLVEPGWDVRVRGLGRDAEAEHLVVNRVEDWEGLGSVIFCERVLL